MSEIDGTHLIGLAESDGHPYGKSENTDVERCTSSK
jgi:hypothetical protein